MTCAIDAYPLASDPSTCYKDCELENPNTFYDADSLVCAECNERCETCHGDTSQECDSCAVNAFPFELDPNTCYQDCSLENNETYLDPDLQICKLLPPESESVSEPVSEPVSESVSESESDFEPADEDEPEIELEIIVAPNPTVLTASFQIEKNNEVVLIFSSPIIHEITSRRFIPILIIFLEDDIRLEIKGDKNSYSYTYQLYNYYNGDGLIEKFVIELSFFCTIWNEVKHILASYNRIWF